MVWRKGGAINKEVREKVKKIRQRARVPTPWEHTGWGTTREEIQKRKTFSGMARQKTTREATQKGI